MSISNNTPVFIYQSMILDKKRKKKYVILNIPIDTSIDTFLKTT